MRENVYFLKINGTYQNKRKDVIAIDVTLRNNITDKEKRYKLPYEELTELVEDNDVDPSKIYPNYELEVSKEFAQDVKELNKEYKGIKIRQEKYKNRPSSAAIIVRNAIEFCKANEKKIARIAKNSGRYSSAEEFLRNNTDR